MTDSIVKNSERVGRFTSSKMYKLMGDARSKKETFSVAGLTYIKQREQERKRKKSLSVDASSLSTAWGDLMEVRVYDLVGLQYSYDSQKTHIHEKYPYWSGSCDLIAPKEKVGEIKGYYPDKFCSYADCLLKEDIDLFRKEFPEEYWQIVSNAIIHNVYVGEAILYQPYESEAEEILKLAEESEDISNMWHYQKIAQHIKDENLHMLPFQPDESDYPNLVTFEFEIPDNDMDSLTNRVLLAESRIKTKLK